MTRRKISFIIENKIRLYVFTLDDVNINIVDFSKIVRAAES